MSSDVPAFKVPVFASDFEFWIKVTQYKYIKDILTQILLTILLPLITLQDENWTFAYYLTPKRNYPRQVKRVSKIWVRMSATNIHLFQFKI